MLSGLTAKQTAITAAGSFLGAGYISGQELWQFFARHGADGFLGFLLSISLICIIMVLVMSSSLGKRSLSVDIVMFGKRNAAFRNLFFLTELSFLFCVASVMSAGTGALLHQIMGCHRILGGAVLLSILIIMCIRGLDTVVSYFSLIIPALVLITFFITWSSVSSDTASVSFIFSTSTTYAGSWIFSALTFSSYNLFNALPSLAIIGGNAAGKKSVLAGCVAACFILFSTGICILFVLLHNNSETAEIPMLYAASCISPILEHIYGVLLFAAMTGSAISCTYGIVVNLTQRYALAQHNPRKTIAAVCVISFLGGQIGFTKLIATVYPAFGVAGAFFLLVYICRIIYVHISRSRASRIAA